MKKYLVVIFSAMLFLAACTNQSEKITERKESITNEETMEYLDRLLEPYIGLSRSETEEQAYKVIEEIDNTSSVIKRELKRDYEKEIHAVNDLIALTDMLIGMAKEVNDGNLESMNAYGTDIGRQIGVIATDYLDGNIPENYAKVIGVDNLYDLE